LQASDIAAAERGFKFALEGLGIESGRGDEIEAAAIVVVAFHVSLLGPCRS
jgi:hypothetical protein